MKKIIIILLTIVILVIAIIIGVNLNSSNDSLKFKKEYESLNGKYDESRKHDYLNVKIDEDNPIVYASFAEIRDLLKNGTGIIYFGFPECPWCRNAIPVLLDATKELSIDKIYYFNALEMRDKKYLDAEGNIVTEETGTDEYKELIEILYESLPAYDGLNDETIKRLYFPTVVFVKEGNIIGLHTSTVDSQENPYIGLNDKEYNELKKIYTDYINETYEILCDQSC